MRDDAAQQASGFTLVELLVVIAVMSVLVGILLPALSGARARAREVACGSHLRQLGAGLEFYWRDFEGTLPQALGPLPGGGEAVIGSLFGGVRGTLPFYGINDFGASRRPLNAYVVDGVLPPDDQPKPAGLEVFRSPLDRGAGNTGVPVPGFESAESMFEMIGSSYVLNDHAPDDDPVREMLPTLVPPQGGKMPSVIDTTRTWVIGTHTLYNFDDDGDREMRWFRGPDVRANMVFLDMHVLTGVRVERGRWVTSDYSFLPTPDWERRNPWR